VDNFPVRRKNPGPCGKLIIRMDQNKTAENKGVWEFDYLLPGLPAASVQAEAAWTSRELVEF